MAAEEVEDELGPLLAVARRPDRDSSWPSAGNRQYSTSLPSIRKATNSCSACSTGQRRSFSECTISTGVSMSRT